MTILTCRPQHYGGARGFRYACNICGPDDHRTWNRTEVERHLMRVHGYGQAEARQEIDKAIRGMG